MHPCSAGKSSIARVVFAKMPPHETLFLEPTAIPRAYSAGANTYMPYTVWEWPADHAWSRATAASLGLTGAGAAGGGMLGASLDKGGAGILSSSITSSMGADRGGIGGSLRAGGGGGGGG